MAPRQLLEQLGFAPKYTERPAGTGWEITVTPPQMMKLPPQTITLTSDQYARFKLWRAGGVLIQDAFPELSKGQREILMSGIGPEDWDRLAPDE